MKPYFAKSGAWVSYEKTFPSGYHIVTLYDPADNVHDKIKCDDYKNAKSIFNEFVNRAKIAKKWGYENV